MTRTSLLTLLILTLAAGTLSACSDAKKQLGMDPITGPDEFSVVKRAPLEMPPDFSLRPPMPGAPRPQEQATSEQARNAILGQSGVTDQVTKGESALLSDAQANANPNIRQIVDTESTKTTGKKTPVVKRLLNIGSDKPAAKIVDPTAEAQRLKNNAEQGKPVTAGATPDIDD
ncbi:MAG: hypothetical protein JWO78_1354 [Micavibrio sp.]|nr:hypothetical protein [Micavibrio sp.]